MIIVGFAGKARTGKSHVCQTLYDVAHDSGWDVKIKPFAGPLKRHVEEVLGFTKDENPDEYRKKCQEIGAGERENDPDHWVNLWKKDMDKEFAEEMDKADRPCLYLVDDVRYPNELRMLNKCDAISLFVKHGTRKIEDPTGEWRNHESEEMANAAEKCKSEALYSVGFDYVLRNDGTPKEITRWADLFVSTVMITHKSEACDCEGCNSALENRPANDEKVDKELNDLLDELRGTLEKEEDDDRDDADDSNT
jgi:hypothetical protein